MKKFGILTVALFLIAGIGQAANWKMDTSHTEVEFKVRHMTVGWVTGSFEKFNGKLSYDPNMLKDASVEVEVEMASVNTSDAKRDDHLRAPDFFDVKSHPKMMFKSKKFSEKMGKIHMIGDLTLRGVTKEVAFVVEKTDTIKDPWGNERFGASATATINRKDFGVSWSKVMDNGGLVVGDNVNIMIEVQWIKEK